MIEIFCSLGEGNLMYSLVHSCANTVFKSTKLLSMHFTKRNALPRPALEGGDDKEGEHGLQHVVIVEVVPLPQPLLLIHLLFHLQEYVT
jgi:hypothetical protein